MTPTFLAWLEQFLVMFMQSKATKALHLSCLGLERVPIQVWEAVHLTRLDLGHNDLTEIPPELGNLTNLQELWLNGNPLKGVPASIQKCQNLQFVDLRDTEIDSLPQEMSRLPKLADVGLSHRVLKPKLAAAYSSGTQKLMEYLARKDEKRGLKDALRKRFTFEIYREIGLTVAGKQKIEDLIQATFKEFTDFEELRLVIRNAERLFPDNITTADVVAIHNHFKRLQTENQIKKLAADLELKIRAIYFDRIRPDAVEGIIKAVFQHVVKLEDVKFLLFFAKDLFPANPADISGEGVLSALIALRAKRKAERDAAIAMLVKAMQNLYGDKEPSAVETAAQSIAKQFKNVEEIKQVAADAATLLPTEFGHIRASKVRRAFDVAQAAKHE